MTTLMRRMGMEAIYRKPRTSIPAPLSAIYPYLLTGLKIERPNHVWAADLTYLPMAHGFHVPGGHHRRGQPQDTVLEGIEHDDARTSASRRWRRRWRNTEARRFSTRTRARSPGLTGRRNEVSDHILLSKSSQQCSLTRMRQKSALDADREAV